ncbi:MAG: UDP-N-acetylmuramate dehydrogenase [Candidatus Saccharimonadales bacterium]
MTITPDVNLANYSTMRLGGIAAFLAEIHDRAELKEAVAWANERKLPIVMIGDGSNVIWKDEGFDGLVLVNKITGFELQNEDEYGTYVVAGAGEPWDSVVAHSVAVGLTGIEALSHIPGTAGATPVQNVGAYGQDISQTLTSVEAFDLTTGQLTNIPAEACSLGYRTSAFKNEYKGRFLITAITLHLMKGNPKPPFYSAVGHYLEEHPADTITPLTIRDAVIAIRASKLPSVEQVANNGSFFANPIIDEGTLTQLRSDHPDMPYWPREGGGAKIPAAWLIEQAGFKDAHDQETGMATWPLQPLVLVNEHAKTTADLLKFKQKIVDAVATKFSIALEQEPELLP